MDYDMMDTSFMQTSKCILCGAIDEVALMYNVDGAGSLCGDCFGSEICDIDDGLSRTFSADRMGRFLIEHQWAWQRMTEVAALRGELLRLALDRIRVR